MKSCSQKQSYKTNGRRNIIKNISNNSPPNILYIHSQFQGYGQKYLRDRRQRLDELLSKH